jgi:hypothetical protein
MRLRLWIGALLVLTFALVSIWLGRASWTPHLTDMRPVPERGASSLGKTAARGPEDVGATIAASTNARPPASAALRAGPNRSGGASTAGVDAGERYPFDKKGLDSAMQSAMPEIDRCYEDWLRAQPTLGGRMKVQFTIDTDDGVEGQVSRVSVGDAGVGNIAFEGCVLSVISALRFQPPLDGARTVTYPLAFIAPPVPPKELQSDLVNLCQRMRSEAQRAEAANVAPDDLLTAVISSLELQTPGLEVYFSALLPSDVPPIQRKETFKRAISKAIGTAWVCPEFEALWDGQPI